MNIENSSIDRHEGNTSEREVDVGKIGEAFNYYFEKMKDMIKEVEDTSAALKVNEIFDVAAEKGLYDVSMLPNEMAIKEVLDTEMLQHVDTEALSDTVRKVRDHLSHLTQIADSSLQVEDVRSRMDIAGEMLYKTGTTLHNILRIAREV